MCQGNKLSIYDLPQDLYVECMCFLTHIDVIHCFHLNNSFCKILFSVESLIWDRLLQRSCPFLKPFSSLKSCLKTKFLFRHLQKCIKYEWQFNLSPLSMYDIFTHIPPMISNYSVAFLQLEKFQCNKWTTNFTFTPGLECVLTYETYDAHHNSDIENKNTWISFTITGKPIQEISSWKKLVFRGILQILYIWFEKNQFSKVIKEGRGMDWNLTLERKDSNGWGHGKAYSSKLYGEMITSKDKIPCIVKFKYT